MLGAEPYWTSLSMPLSQATDAIRLVYVVVAGGRFTVRADGIKPRRLGSAFALFLQGPGPDHGAMQRAARARDTQRASALSSAAEPIWGNAMRALYFFVS